MALIYHLYYITYLKIRFESFVRHLEFIMDLLFLLFGMVELFGGNELNPKAIDICGEITQYRTDTLFEDKPTTPLAYHR